MQFHQPDPLLNVVDEPLVVSPALLCRLREYRDEPKLVNLPGMNTEEERARLVLVLEHLVTGLLQGLEAQPRKYWVMQHFQHALKLVQYEDTEGREHFGLELQRIMELLGINSSDGLLNHYLLGW